MDLHCPIDRVAFVTLATYGTEINYYPKCGLWIDCDEIRQLDRLNVMLSSDSMPFCFDAAAGAMVAEHTQIDGRR
jgi:Zn-finger nucleic acid-binding protein